MEFTVDLNGGNKKYITKFLVEPLESGHLEDY